MLLFLLGHKIIDLVGGKDFPWPKDQHTMEVDPGPDLGAEPE